MGFRFQVSTQPLAAEATSLIDKRTLEMKFHTSAAAGQKTASLIEIETFSARFRNRPLLGFAFRNYTGKM